MIFRTIRLKRLSFQNVHDALSYLLDIIYIRLGLTFPGQIVGIPIDSYCAPLWQMCFCFLMKEIL